MNIEKNKVFIQIGTNDGYDDFNNIVKTYSPSKVILVEPNKHLNKKINEAYSGIDNVFLENLAITDINKGVVKLVIPKNNSFGRSVNGVNYGDPSASGGFSLIPMDDWGDDFETIETDSMSLNDLCEKYEINDIHYLQIDTEGYDSEIIKSIDFSRLKIDIIKYEWWGFSEDAFKRYGDKSKLYGLNGMNYVSNLLESLGYTVNKIMDSDGTTNMLAIKIEYKNKIKL